VRLTHLIIVIMLVIGFGLVALYREVGVGRDADITSGWPFGNLPVGGPLGGLPDDAFTGFLAICTDDADAFAAINSVAVVAEDWDYPVHVAVGRTLRPNGWKDRIDTLPGNVSRQEMSMPEITSLQPADLPVVVFLQDGRVLDASLEMGSPGEIAGTFQRCRFGLAR
jgi:hypothetical protein